MKSSSASIPSSLRLPEEGRLLLAFSGGSDSLALMAILSQVAPERTVALYVDHNIRSRSELDREIELNKANAESLGIPLLVETIPPGLVEETARLKRCGTEAAARTLRYSILYRYAEENGFDYILTAHHRKDQIETILMRILDGSPFWTWRGIEERNGRILRPMLSFSKAEIAGILEERGLVPSEDSTNADLSFSRNNIRFNVFPLLSEGEKELLCHVSENIAEIRNSFEPIALKDHGLWCSYDPEEFLSSLPPIQERLVYSVFRFFSCGSRVRRTFVRDLVEKTREAKGRLETDRLVFYFSPTFVKVYNKPTAFCLPFDGVSTRLPDGLSVALEERSELTLRIPAENLEEAILRTPVPGDRILLKEGCRRIADLEKAMRIPSSIVLEKDGRIVAFFAFHLGGRDRLAAGLLGKFGVPVSIESEESL